MSVPRLPPETARAIERLKVRVTILEKLLAEFRRAPRLEKVFTLAGVIYESTSTKWEAPGQVTIGEIVVLLGVAGSTSTTIVVARNGVTIETLVIASGVVRSTLTVGHRLTVGDLLTVAVSVVGTGAQNLTVICRFR